MSVHAFPLPLPTPSSVEAPALRSVSTTPPAPRPEAKQRRPVWLAVHLRGSQLHAALAALTDKERHILSSKPIAVVESDRRATVVACNSIAGARGVRAGHSLNASIALCADTQFLPRDLLSEDRLLEQLATHCERFTSTVSTEPPNELLLEIRGSLKLFGGIDALIKTVQSDLCALGMTPQIAVAPTAQSALWLSRAAAKPIVIRPRELIATIGRLPVSYMLWPADIELRLARFGVLTIGDLLRLPRAGLSRRIGHDHLAELDRALGRHREVRRRHRTSELYRDVVPLDFEIETTGLLSTVIEKRFARLSRYLRKRTLAIDRVQIDLKHRDREATPVVVGLACATSDTAHIAKLMHEHLDKLALPAPVKEIVIRVDRFQAQTSASHDLFSRELLECVTSSTEAQARLLEQLSSRLGNDSVQQIRLQPDYRPEFANQLTSACVTETVPPVSIPQSLARRPLWLLSSPRALRSYRSSSMFDTSEVIESGWWDGVPVHREYGTVLSSRGALVWAFRDALHRRQPFVHGLFG